jgi:hypothetical protein
MNSPTVNSWFFRNILSERQALVFLIAFWFAVLVQAFAVHLPGPDFDFAGEKGTFATYLELLDFRVKLAAFREGFLWCWIGLQAVAIFTAVKLRSWIGLVLAVVLPMLWIFLMVGRFTP